jgi:uncharacterized protein (DUF3084 family)
MNFLEKLSEASSYNTIREIIATQLVDVKGVIELRYSSLKTDFLANEAVRFDCCLLSDTIWDEQKASKDIIEALDNLNCEIQCVGGIFKKDNKHALYVHIRRIDSNQIPLVKHLIRNAINTRKKQFLNMEISDRAETYAKDFIKNDETLQQLKKAIAERKTLLKKKADKIKNDYLQTNQLKISETEEALYNQVGEQLGSIALW